MIILYVLSFDLNHARHRQLLGDATEQLSFKLGPTLSGLLNASFGNAVEIIVGIAALLQGAIIFSNLIRVYPSILT